MNIAHLQRNRLCIIVDKWERQRNERFPDITKGWVNRAGWCEEKGPLKELSAEIDGGEASEYARWWYEVGGLESKPTRGKKAAENGLYNQRAFTVAQLVQLRPSRPDAEKPVSGRKIMQSVTTTRADSLIRSSNCAGGSAFQPNRR